jgi:hypothetical protein
LLHDLARHSAGHDTLTSAPEHSYRIRCLVTWRVTQPPASPLTSAPEHPDPRSCLDDLSHHSRLVQPVGICDKASVLNEHQDAFTAMKKQWFSLLHFQLFSTRFHRRMHMKLFKLRESRMQQRRTLQDACAITVNITSHQAPFPVHRTI